MLKFERQGGVSTCTVQNIRYELTLRAPEVDNNGVFVNMVKYEVWHVGEGRLLDGIASADSWLMAEEFVQDAFEVWLKEQLNFLQSGNEWYNDDLVQNDDDSEITF